eukprot:5552_1
MELRCLIVIVFCLVVINTADTNMTDLECGGFDNCMLYYDGCNTCSCDEDGTMCTEMACDTEKNEECRQCQDGYELINDECGIFNCGGFRNCQIYYDGCNTCTCSDENVTITMCTQMACTKYESKRCTECVESYECDTDPITDRSCSAKIMTVILFIVP